MPAAVAQIAATDDFYLAEPYTIWFRVFASERVVTAAPCQAGALTLTIQPLTRPLLVNSKIYFPDAGFSVKLSAPALVGTTSLSVIATAGPIQAGLEGRRQLDASGMTLTWALSKKEPQTTSPVILTKTPSTTADPADPDIASQFLLAVVTKDATDLAATPPGVYVQRLFNSTTGRTLAYGDVLVKAR